MVERVLRWQRFTVLVSVILSVLVVNVWFFYSRRGIALQGGPRRRPARGCQSLPPS